MNSLHKRNPLAINLFIRILEEKVEDRQKSIKFFIKGHI